MSLFKNGYALVVGIANYTKVRPLPTTVLKDAADISELLTNPAYCGYPADHVRCLLDGQATASAIRSGLRWLANQTSKEDTAIFFFSGHGGRINGGGNYLIPVDADPQALSKTAIEGAELTALLQNINAGRLLVLFDCCHAGAIGQAKDAFASTLPQVKFCLDEEVYTRLSQGEGRAIIASSRSNELSLVLPDMENSLFTHYLLKALRGEAYTRGDGVIRIWDLFDFTSQEVARHDARQHPVIKANLQSNFAIALDLGGQEKMNSTTKFVSSKIDNPQNLRLPDEGILILDKMFATYRGVTIKQELGGGYSRACVFVVRPLKNGAELPAVIKMGPAEMIKKEWQAFQTHARNQVPHAPQIEGQPVFSNRWGGIRYPLVGHDEFTIEGLRDYCRHAPIQDIQYVLKERLFRSLRTIWRNNQVKHDLTLQRSYDPILPVNYVIECIAQPKAPLHPLNPQTYTKQTAQVGDYVWLSGFRVTKINADKKTMFLNLPSPSRDGLPVSYQVRLESVQEIASYQENQELLSPIIGVITKTRQMRLSEEAQQALGKQRDLTEETVTLSNGINLPNPLVELPKILTQSLDVRVASIHGDLNTQNIIVEHDHQNRNIYLIDFANARHDHVLHDLLRLETEILINLLPQLFSEASLPSETIVELYQKVHCTRLHPQQQLSVPQGLEKAFTILQIIRQEAQRYLVNRDKWHEYYYGLTLYLLGALKFKNLDKEPTAPLPKQIAFWGAATTLSLLEAEPDCDESDEMATKKTRTTTQPSQEKRAQVPHQKPAPTREPPRSPSTPNYRDLFSDHETGMARLLERMGRDHPRYADALVYQQQLEYNIARTRRFGDTETRRSERSEIIDRLNGLALPVLGVSFNELCS